MADERKRSDDLEDEPPKGKKGKKEKPEKKGKKIAETEEGAEGEGKKGKKKDKPVKEKKPHPVMKTFFSTSLLWLALLMVTAVLTYINFNFFGLMSEGMKEIVLQRLNPELDFEIMYESDIQGLKDWETELDGISADLDERSYELDSREDAVAEREDALEEQQYELEEKYPQAFDEEAQENTIPFDISSMVKTTGEMTPAKAAEAMLLMDQENAILLLNELKPAQKAAILDAMSAEDRASFMDAMVTPE